MLRKIIKAIGVGAAVVVLSHMPIKAAKPEFQYIAERPAELVFTQTETNAQKPDIQWFKDRMKISEKYAESGEGILGMSWAHFFTMVLLVLFATGALVAFIQRQRRTREILERIRKEMTNGNSG